MRYQDFIAEAKGLITGGDAIKSLATTHENPDFRRWRHHAENLVREVTAHGYRLPGSFKSDLRAYRAMHPGASFPANANALEKDIGDSLIELRFIVDHYDKYGEPVMTQLVQQAQAGPATAPHVELAAPEKVSIAWLAKNVSVGFWVKVVSVGIGLVLLGAAVGQTEPFKSIVQWFKTNWPF